MKKALMLWGGWDGHQPKASVDRFAPFLEANGFEVTLAGSLTPLEDSQHMTGLDLIVPCWTMGELAPAQEQGLLDAVRRGCGIAGWHGGLCDAFRANTAYQFMTGGQFVEHPGGIIDYVVHIVRPDDPIVQGIQDFPVRSEQYYMHVDPSNAVLASTSFRGDVYPWIDGCVMPVVWKRRFGEGRVFYSALGHTPAEFDVSETRTIMERGLLWASR